MARILKALDPVFWRLVSSQSHCSVPLWEGGSSLTPVLPASFGLSCSRSLLIPCFVTLRPIEVSDWVYKSKLKLSALFLDLKFLHYLLLFTAVHRKGRLWQVTCNTAGFLFVPSFPSSSSVYTVSLLCSAKVTSTYLNWHREGLLCPRTTASWQTSGWKARE